LLKKLLQFIATLHKKIKMQLPIYHIQRIEKDLTK
jgi:hydroxypyruvate isomerase